MLGALQRIAAGVRAMFEEKPKFKIGQVVDVRMSMYVTDPKDYKRGTIDSGPIRYPYHDSYDHWYVLLDGAKWLAPESDIFPVSIDDDDDDDVDDVVPPPKQAVVTIEEVDSSQIATAYDLPEDHYVTAAGNLLPHHRLGGCRACACKAAQPSTLPDLTPLLVDDETVELVRRAEEIEAEKEALAEQANEFRDQAECVDVVEK